jgi:hypothetical protein
MVADVLSGVLNQELFIKNRAGAIPGADSVALLRETTINH